MLQHSLQELQWAMDAELHGVIDGSIRDISTDSRTITNGQAILFFALAGERYDAHSYVEQLYHEKGVRHFVVSKILLEYHELPEASFLFVEDTLRALQMLATYHRQRFQLPIVAITGSNGKTIVKEWAYQVLSPDFRAHHSPKSYNSQVGVPLSLLGLAPGFELGIYEAGISQPGEMASLASMIYPTIGLITNIGQAHQENFPDLKAKCREKLSLFAHAKKLLLCRDQELVYEEAQKIALQNGIEIVSWSIEGKEATLAINIGEEKDASDLLPFQASYHGKTFSGLVPRADSATVENALHTLLLALEFGIEPEKAIERIKELQPLAMRLERREGTNGYALINDSYSCDLDSLSVALDFLDKNAIGQKKAIILSDIYQSGLPQEQLYRQVALMANQHGIELIVGVGPEISHHRDFFPDGSLFFPSTELLLRDLPASQLHDFATLVKGSRKFAFERVVKQLEKKRHSTVMEINLNALESNLNYFKSLLKPEVKILVLVKAFAYGNGIEELAQFLQFHKVDYLGVAYADEGSTLRDAGIELPILVLNPAPDSYDLLIAKALEPEIISVSTLHAFTDALKKTGKTNYPIHLKLDTGMHRAGFTEEDVSELLEILPKVAEVRVQSIMTHLAAADDPQEDAFTRQQLSDFEKLCGRIENCLGYRPLRHALNSAGIERFPEHMHDMVRLGIGLHGISALADRTLAPVASLKSYIAQIKHLQPSDTVGYGRHGKITAPATIATIPIGYADGYARCLGNGKARVAVNGHLAPTIGNICMDTCMIDITGIAAKEGDSVTLFGSSPALQQLAEWLETIPYEVLSTISPRVVRVYFAD